MSKTIVVAYVLLSWGMMGYLCYELKKATVCNKVMVRYFSIYGINIDLDRMYEDGKRWVDDPKYNNFPNRRIK